MPHDQPLETENILIVLIIVRIVHAECASIDVFRRD